MAEMTREELEEAQKAIASIIRKCEKAQQTLGQKQPPRTSQLTLLSRRLRAMHLAMRLIERELGGLETEQR